MCEDESCVLDGKTPVQTGIPPSSITPLLSGTNPTKHHQRLKGVRLLCLLHLACRFKKSHKKCRLPRKMLYPYRSTRPRPLRHVRTGRSSGNIWTDQQSRCCHRALWSVPKDRETLCHVLLESLQNDGILLVANLLATYRCVVFNGLLILPFLVQPVSIGH